MDIDIPSACSGGENSGSYDHLLNTPIKKIQNLTIHSPTSSHKYTAHYTQSPSGLYPNLQDIFDLVSSNEDKENSYPRKKLVFESPKPKIQQPSASEDQIDIKTAMINKGYSQKITNAVLDELTMRSSEISHLINSATATGLASSGSKSSQEEKEKRRKRFSLVHKSRFNKMESISNHYSLPRIISNKSLDLKPDVASSHGQSFHRSTQESPKQRDSLMDEDMDIDMKNKRLSTTNIGSISKRRRTLNGPEEVLPQNTEATLVGVSPTRGSHQEQISPIRNTNIPSSPFKDASIVSSPFSFTASLSPFKSNIPTLASSSPTKGISPSKKSYNLNLLLQGNEAPQLAPPQTKPQPPPQPQVLHSFARPQKPQHLPQHLPQQTASDSSHVFLKPFPPSLKNRPSSLELAGVKATASRKPSQSNLNDSASQHLTHRTSRTSLIPRKPSNSSLQKQPLVPHLSKTSSIPQLQKKPSSTFNSHNSLESSRDYHNLNQRPPELASPVRSTSSHSLSSHKPVTKPQPFSLYNRPTISSSQKSMGSQSSSTTGNHYSRSVSQTSLGNQYPSSKSLKSSASSATSDINIMPDKSASLSQRSLYKYQQFKKRFH